jgi:hypothetical protein
VPAPSEVEAAKESPPVGVDEPPDELGSFGELLDRLMADDEGGPDGKS